MTGSALTLGLTVALYLIGAALLGANLFLRRPALLIAGRSVAAVAAIAHTTAIGLRCVELKQAPFTTPAEALSALAWMVVLAYLAAELLWRLSATGPFALGLAFLLVLAAGIDRRPYGVADPALLASNVISLHIIAILAAFAAFALAFCCAALYLIEHHILKSKHGLAWLKRLPPLTTVESAAFALVAFGFPLLTLGILAGLLRAWDGPPGDAFHTSAHSVLAYTVWLVYGLFLVARLAADWPPVRTSYVLLVGLALCLLLFFIPTGGTPRFG